MGYVGPVLTKHLLKEIPTVEIHGFDSGFFSHCLTTNNQLPEVRVKKQYFGDLRDINKEILVGIDCVVHLGAISNDPMGNKFESATKEINYHASCKLANLANEMGVKNFVFASSCSIYGKSGEGPRRETDPLNPLTEYAKSKVRTEDFIRQLPTKNCTFTSLRFATACGMSDRLRLDLVLNDFVASAVTKGKVTILSDGSPWRPLIDVNDMSRAIHWALFRKPSNKNEKFLAINAGSDLSNYQIKDLAKEVIQLIPEASLDINTNAEPDKRSYKVNFSLFKELAPLHQPKVTIQQSIVNLKNGLDAIHFKDKNFRSSKFMRLKTLETLLEKKLLDSNFYWQN